MITRRTLLGSMGAAALIAPLTACGGDDTGTAGEAASPLPSDATATLTMAWWGNDDRAGKYKASLDEFKKKYPNITVQTQFQPFADYWTARNTEAAGDALPDVMQMDLSYLRQFANNNRLLKLDDFIGKGLDVTGFEESLLQVGKLNDATYGIATSTNTLAMFYHQAVLDKLKAQPFAEGYTWTDYVNAVKAAAPAGQAMNPKLYLGGNLGGTFWFFIQWLVQKGVKPFTDDNKLGITKDHAKEWLNIFDSMNTDAIRYPPQRADQLAPKGGFTNNEIATEMSWDNFLSGYVADSGDKDIKMMPVPSGDDGKPHMFFKPSMLLSAGANTKNPAAAATLISFLVNDPAVGKIFGTSKGVPAVKAQRDAMALEAGSVDEKVVKYEEQVASLVTEPTPLPVEGYGALEAAWLRLASDYGYGKITVDQWVDQWFTAADETLQG